jgi:hypothetical protein
MFVDQIGSNRGFAGTDAWEQLEGRSNRKRRQLLLASAHSNEHFEIVDVSR